MDIIDLGRYLGALLLVLGLLGAAALGTRRFGLPGIVKGAATRRLSLVETLMVGPRHKLFLLRRDGVEHLVLMGPQGASVVETGIFPPQASVNLHNANSAGHDPAVPVQHCAEISA
jgi:flagellar protein FliO/FliZ